MKMKTGSKFIALMLLLMIGKMMNVSAQQEISRDNMHLRYETDGKVIDAHDGRLVKFIFQTHPSQPPNTQNRFSCPVPGNYLPPTHSRH